MFDVITTREYGLKSRSLISLTSWGNQIGLSYWLLLLKDDKTFINVHPDQDFSRETCAIH